VYVFVCVSVCDAGFHVIHSIANILLIYVVLATTGGTRLSVILAFIINMVCRTFYVVKHLRSIMVLL